MVVHKGQAMADINGAIEIGQLLVSVVHYALPIATSKPI
jgi:hypothetical protein